MNIIDSAIAMARALDQPIEPDLTRLLTLRREQLTYDVEDELGALASFIIVAPGDTLATIEAAAGYPVVTYGAFEWVQRHGRWFEAVAILSDDGFATVLLVPDDEGVDPVLLSFMRAEAASSKPVTSTADDTEQPTLPPS